MPINVPQAPHPWRITPRRAVVVQRQLSSQVRLTRQPPPRRVVGLDCAFAGTDVLAVAVVWDVLQGRVVETRGARQACDFPYVPGLLSFREVPVLLKVLRRVVTDYQAVMCDGQGIAHPRRFGLASHLGVILQMPTLGCAKSRLVGSHSEVGHARGDRTPLLDHGERIGTVLRTRDGVRAVYVSPGHLCSHANSVDWVLRCGAGYRIPEPTRLADRLVAAYKRSGHFRGGVEAASDND